MGSIKNDKYIPNYDLVEINRIKKLYEDKEILIYSPIIQRRIDEELVKIQDINYKSQYLEDLAKVHIFMEQFPFNEKYLMLNQMFEEQLFATYEYLKETGIEISFEQIFNKQNFDDYIGIGYTTGDFPYGTTDTAKTLSNPKRITFNPRTIEENTLKIYSIMLEEVETHEVQHFVSGDGLKNKLPFWAKDLSGNLYLNEMCTEYNAIQIVKTQLDDSLNKRQIIKKFDNSNKITFYAEGWQYTEILQFYDAMNIISGNKFNEMYYDADKGLNSLEDKNIIKGFQKISKLYTQLYNRKDIKNETMIEKKYDDLIKAFTDLSEYHIRNGIGLDENTDLDSTDGKTKLSELKVFFDSFESITFKKSNETLYERDIIKNNLLESVFKDKEKIKTVVDKLQDKEEVEEVSINTEKEISNEVVKAKSISEVTVSPNTVYFTPSFSETKLKENIQNIEIECSLSNMKEFFDKHIKKYGFISNPDGSYSKDNTSDEEIKSIVRDFVKDRPHFDGCIESVTATKNGDSHIITDYTLEQELKQRAIKKELEDLNNDRNKKNNSNDKGSSKDSKNKGKDKDDFDLDK